MGWASGTSLMYDVWNIVRDYIPPDMYVELFARVAEQFWERDADNLYELLDDFPEAKEALLQIGYLDPEDLI